MAKYEVYLKGDTLADARPVLVDADGYVFVNAASTSFGLPSYDFKRGNSVVAQFRFDSVVGISLKA